MRYFGSNIPSTSVMRITCGPLDNETLDILVPRMLKVFGYGRKALTDTFLQAEVYNLLLGIIRQDQHEELCSSEAQLVIKVRHWLLRVESNWSMASPLHVVYNLNDGTSLALINHQLLMSN